MIVKKEYAGLVGYWPLNDHVLESVAGTSAKAAIPRNCVWVESESPIAAGSTSSSTSLTDAKTINSLGSMSMSKTDARSSLEWLALQVSTDTSGIKTGLIRIAFLTSALLVQRVWRGALARKRLRHIADALARFAPMLGDEGDGAADDVDVQMQPVQQPGAPPGNGQVTTTTTLVAGGSTDVGLYDSYERDQMATAAWALLRLLIVLSVGGADSRSRTEAESCVSLSVKATKRMVEEYNKGTTPDGHARRGVLPQLAVSVPGGRQRAVRRCSLHTIPACSTHAPAPHQSSPPRRPPFPSVPFSTQLTSPRNPPLLLPGQGEPRRA